MRRKIPACSSLSLLKKHEDKRGSFVEFLKYPQSSSKKNTQFFYATIKPGKSRGNHYHRGLDEWLIVIEGKIKLILEDISTQKRSESILAASGGCVPMVKIRANAAHAVKNTSKKVSTILGYLTSTADFKRKDRWEFKPYRLIKS